MNYKKQENLERVITEKIDFLNYLNLQEPHALFIPFTTNNYQEIPAWYEREQVVIDALRAVGIDAVLHCSKEAEDPAKTVVTSGGVQTQILSSKEAKKAAKIIIEAILLAEFPKSDIFDDRYVMFPKPVQIEQLCSSYEKKTDIIWQEGGNSYLEAYHPNKDIYNKIRNNYGPNFEFELLDEVLNNEQLLTLDNFYEKNMNKINYLYRGATQGENPYALLTYKESKALAYATPSIKVASKYTGLDNVCKYGITEAYKTNSPFTLNAYKDEESISFGFIYEYEATNDIRLWDDWGLEKGGSYLFDSKKNEFSNSTLFDEVNNEGKTYLWDKEWETPIYPENNKCVNKYIHIVTDGKDCYFKIPENNKRWQAFLSLYNTSDITLDDHMAKRREAIIKSPKVYPLEPKVLGVFRKKIKPKDFKKDFEESYPNNKLIISQYTIQSEQLLRDLNRKDVCFNSGDFSDSKEIKCFCKKIDLSYAKNLPELLDFSPCEDVDLTGCDLSKVKIIILPPKGSKFEVFGIDEQDKTLQQKIRRLNNEKLDVTERMFQIKDRIKQKSPTNNLSPPKETKVDFSKASEFKYVPTKGRQGI